MPGNNKPAALQVGVEPGADIELCWQAISFERGLFLIEFGDNGPHIIQGQHGGVGVSAINQDLHRATVAQSDLLGALLPHPQDQKRFFTVNERGDI